MKKFLLLVLATSGLSAMEESVESLQDRCYWQELSEEIQQHLLSFVPTPGQLKDISNTQLVSKAINRLTQDLVFLAEFAKRTFEQDKDKALRILLRAAWFEKKEITTAFINADIMLKKAAGSHLHFLPDFSQIEPAHKEAMQAQYVKYFRTLLEAGADPNERAAIKVGLDDRLHARNFNGLVKNRTPLMEACKFGNQEIAELLIRAGADVNARDADVNAHDEDRVNALMEAIFANNKSIVLLLLDNGATLSSGGPEFVYCANNKDTEILDLLFARGLQIPAIPQLGLNAQGTQSLAKIVIQGAQLLKSMQDNPGKQGECAIQ